MDKNQRHAEKYDFMQRLTGLRENETNIHSSISACVKFSVIFERNAENYTEKHQNSTSYAFYNAEYVNNGNRNQ